MATFADPDGYVRSRGSPLKRSIGRTSSPLISGASDELSRRTVGARIYSSWEGTLWAVRRSPCRRSWPRRSVLLCRRSAARSLSRISPPQRTSRARTSGDNRSSGPRSLARRSNGLIHGPQPTTEDRTAAFTAAVDRLRGRGRSRPEADLHERPLSGSPPGGSTPVKRTLHAAASL